MSSVATEGDVVVVKVGPKLVEYRLHSTTLVHNSEYFRQALSKNWKEGEEKGT